MQSQRTLDETLQNRAMVDAIREILGQAPLYNKRNTDPSSWLTDIVDGYRSMRAAGPKAKGKRGVNA